MQPAQPAELGTRIRQLRQQRGLSQEDLAGDGISGSYVSRIESGNRAPTRRVLEQLAERLGTTVEHLLTGVSPQRAEQLQLDLGFARLALQTGQAAEAERRFRALLADRAAADSPDIRREVRCGLGCALEALGQLEAAIEVLEALLPELPVGGADWLDVVITLCRCYREAGDLGRAIDLGEHALTELRALDLVGTENGVRVSVTLLAAYFERGDVTRAAQLAQEAIGRAESLDDPTARASAYWNASLVLEGRGRPADALPFATRALALLSEGSDERNLARLRIAYAGLLLRQQEAQPAEALPQLRRAQEALQQGSGSAVDLASAEVEEARARLLLGDVDEASRLATAALDRLEPGPRLEAAAALALRGQAALLRGDAAAALAAYRQAVATLSGVGASRRAAELWTELGELFHEAGEADKALEAFRAANACLGLVRPSRPAVVRPLSPSEANR